jgi:hypothetical protein
VGDGDANGGDCDATVEDGEDRVGEGDANGEDCDATVEDGEDRVEDGDANAGQEVLSENGGESSERVGRERENGNHGEEAQTDSENEKGRDFKAPSDAR